MAGRPKLRESEKLQQINIMVCGSIPWDEYSRKQRKLISRACEAEINRLIKSGELQALHSSQ